MKFTIVAFALFLAISIGIEARAVDVKGRADGSGEAIFTSFAHSAFAHQLATCCVNQVTNVHSKVLAHAQLNKSAPVSIICPLCIRAPTCDLKCEIGTHCELIGKCPCTAVATCVKDAPTSTSTVSVGPTRSPIIACPQCYQICKLECGENEYCGFEGPCQCTAKQVCLPKPTDPVGI
ncbi:hypothetical protein HK098_005147 [Nowakowskiella sp. JEL0407]|nr:hypothetical protein HK098_005147 [Nowakowskiella sp. JEL0407]